jgi:hypothetical protein
MQHSLYPRVKRSGTLSTGGWLGSSASLDKGGKSHPPPAPRTHEPLARRYTDYDIPTQRICFEILIFESKQRLGNTQVLRH